MRVVSKSKILEFARTYSDVLDPLLDWERDMKRINATTILELRQTFPTVDFLKGWDLYCFNIKGNHYRLIAGIHWGYAVYIKELLTHAQYTKKYVKGVNK